MTFLKTVTMLIVSFSAVMAEPSITIFLTA
jgi:hypothetical protein